MSQLIEQQTTVAPKRTNSKLKDVPQANDLPGTVTGTLGSGDNAKNSIIFLTIKYAFVTGTIISVLVIVNYWCFRQNEKVPDFTSDIKLVWEIIIPIITLALGYAFGKSTK